MTDASTARSAPAEAADAEPSSDPAWAPDVPANEPDPLISALATIAGLLDKPVSPNALLAGLPTDGGAVTPDLAVRAAEGAGLRARIVRRRDPLKIAREVLPCVLLMRDGGACILLDVERDGARVLVPGTGERRLSRQALADSYSGFAMLVSADFRFDARTAEVQLGPRRGWFWGTLARFWPVYGHVLVASAVINTFALAMPLFIMNVYDRVVPNQAIETLWALAIGVLVVFAFEFLMRNLRSYFVDTAGKNADVIISSNILGRLLSVKLASKDHSTGSIANNIREFESLREFFTSGTVVALVDLPFIFLFIGVIWLIAGPVAFVPLAVVPLVILVGVLLQLPMRRLMESSHREAAQKHAILVEAVEGIETVKTSAAEGSVQRDWERCVGTTAETAKRARVLATLSTSFAQTAIQLATVFVVVFGVYRIANGDLTMGALVAATILTGRALAPLSTIAGMLTRIQQSRVALRALDRLMKTPTERPEGKSFLHRPQIRGAAEFKDVTFTYPGQRKPALDGVSLRIQAGEKVALIGRVGSGKSTIARLMLGLYEPDSGSIRIDDTEITQYDPADLRRNVGYVSQDNYLFFGSVRDNIRFSAPGADEAAVERAGEIAGVSDFLKTTMEGLDLPVGERGQSISGGQRQAIAIARALLLDPPLLVFDEPTSHMDNSSETRFRDRLGKVLERKTLLLSTHRTSLLNLVDRVVVLENGKIVADGPRDQILQSLRQGRLRAAG